MPKANTVQSETENKKTRLPHLLVRYGYDPDTPIEDVKEWWVRRELAYQGVALDQLVNDPEMDVRVAVVRHEYGLDQLVSDPEWEVRAEVARHRYGLDQLVSDEEGHVRREVAKHGYGLDKLVKDQNRMVREEAALQSMKLLSKNTDEFVRVTASGVLEALGWEEIK